MNGHNKGDHYRLYRIQENLILTILADWKHREWIELPKFDLPDGWELHGVEWSEMYRGFSMIVWHPSFPVVPPGTYTPAAGDVLGVERVVIQVGPSQAMRDLAIDDALADKVVKCAERSGNYVQELELGFFFLSQDRERLRRLITEAPKQVPVVEKGPA